MASGLALVLLLITAGPALGGFNFSCPQVTSSAMPPVVHSSSYSYRVSISIKGKNETIVAHEMYDMTNGSIRLFVHFPNPDNSTQWVSEAIHHDYNYNQTLTYDVDSKTCVVSDLEHNETYSIFGLGIEEGFKTPQYSYYWMGDYNYTQENNTIVNGVIAEKYSTCALFNSSQIKYNVELYFAVDDWNSRAGANAPLMVVLKVNQTEDGGESFVTETYTYTFTSYHGKSSDSWHFGDSDPHWDIICPGRKDALPVPEPSNSFSVSEEMVDPVMKTIYSSRQHYNYPEKLFRQDFVAPKNFTWGLPNHHHTIIHDFHAGVKYVMDRELGNCTIEPLSLTTWDFDITTDPSHPGFYHMRDYVKFSNERNFTYTGRHARLGLTIDSWTSAIPYKVNTAGTSVEMNETLIFSTSDWKSSDVSPVPLGVRFSIKKTSPNGTSVSSAMVKMSAVSHTMHGTHSFEIGSCFKRDSSRRFVIKFDSSYGKYLDGYSEKMDEAIRTAVSKAAKISKLRVSSWSVKQLAVDAASGNNNEQKLFISFRIYDHANIHGNISEYVSSLNLTEAVANLKNAVGGNKLLVQFTVKTNEMVSMTAYPGYFKEQNDLYSPSPASSDTLSNGAIAGLSIGMAVLGFVIGAVVIHVRYKRGNRQFGYSIQD